MDLIRINLETVQDAQIGTFNVKNLIKTQWMDSFKETSII